jgi:outer membrane receptor protein involved in Fe transport
VADTVTVLPGIKVESDRAKASERVTATTVRADRGKLMRFLPANAGDALVALPGVDLVKTGSWASRVSMRGLTGERVLVMVDGVRLQSGRGHGAQTSLLSVDKLESLEMDPGAGGAAFGADALGGTLNLITHRPLFSPTSRNVLTLAARGTTPGDEQSAFARLRMLNPNWGAEISGGLGSLDALATPQGEYPNSGHREEDFGLRGVARIGVLQMDAEHTHHAAYDVGLPAFSSNAGSRAFYPVQGRDVDRLELTVPEDARRPAVSLLAVQQRFRTDFVESTVDSQFLRGRFVATSHNDAEDVITTWSRGLQPRMQKGPLRLMGEWRVETTSGPRTTEASTVNASGAVTATSTTSGESVPPARRDVLGGGANLSFEPLWDLRIELGARYDWLHSRADSTPQSFTSELDVVDEQWTWEAGLARRVGAWTPYGRVATGFRPANLEERYFNNSVHGGMRVFGNPDLVSESSLTTELGVRAAGAWGDLVPSARLSVYRSEVDEMISLKYLGQLYLVPRFQYTNIENARLEGAELSTDLALGATRLTVNAAIPRGTDLATGEEITDIGAARATIDLRLPLPRMVPMGSITMRARWTDAVPASATGTDLEETARASYWTGAVEMAATWWDTRVTASVRNLANATYYEPMSFIPEPGRQFTIAVRRDLALPALGIQKKATHP